MAAEHVERIGRRIRERREEIGLSQGDVARELPGKVDGNQVSRWERGLHRPQDETLEQLGRVLRVDPAYFMSDGPSRSASASAQELGDDEQQQQLDRIEAKLERVLSLLGQAGFERELHDEVRGQQQPREPGSAAA